MRKNAEIQTVFYYLDRLTKRTTSFKAEDRLCGWFENNAPYLIGRKMDKDWNSIYENRHGKKDSREKKLPRTVQTIRAMIAKIPFRAPENRIAQAICDAFHLSPQYHGLITLWAESADSSVLPSLFDYHNDRTEEEMMAGMLGLSYLELKNLFSIEGELSQRGMIKVNYWGRITKSDHLESLLTARVKTAAQVKSVLLGKPMKGTLRAADFSQIGEDYGHMKKILAGATARTMSGVNILIHGEPGTGKTELAQSVCRDLGLALYNVSGNRDEQSGYDRRGELASAEILLKGESRCALLMDEAEDVFGNQNPFMSLFGKPDGGVKSKLFLNRLLDQVSVPVIWIANRIEGIDPAYLRRFSHIFLMERPDGKAQTRIWRRRARKHGVKISDGDIDRLVRRFDLPPALINTSLKTASLTGEAASVEKTVRSLQSAMTGARVRKGDPSMIRPFSSALLNCDVDLTRLTEQLVKGGKRRFSLCLYGVSGSGKSAYARHLAAELGMKPVYRRGSDLIDPYVGMTERHIAEAFAEASRKKGFLIIDEADSFLRDRRLSRNGWEVTQVNEMLTQMESHPLPFVFTTNLMEDIDQASLRRFTFKVRYDYLTPDQTEAAFRHFFGRSGGADLARLTCVTPGDFAVAAKKGEILDIRETSELIALLRSEAEVKEESREIGFKACF